MKRLLNISVLMCVAMLALSLSAAADNSLTVDNMDTSSITLSTDVRDSHDLFFALYQDGALKQLVHTDNNELSTNLNMYAEKGYTIKAFCWNDDLKPLAAPVEFNTYTSGQNPSLQLSEDVLYVDDIPLRLSDSVKVYVNGRDKGDMTKAATAEFLSDNSGLIIDKLVFKGISGQAYDSVYADFYGTAMVESVDGDAITFGGYSDDIDEESLNLSGKSYKLYMNDEEIQLADIKKNDVLSIRYDGNDSFDSSAYYDIYVTRESYEEKCEGIGTEYPIVYTIGGKRYTVTTGTNTDLQLGAVYEIHLDKFGNIAFADETGSGKSIGVLKNVYKKAGGDFAAVIITDNGAEQEYGMDVLEYASLAGNSGEYDALTDENIDSRIVEYTVRKNGTVHIKEFLTPQSSGSAEYKQSSAKIGSVAIDDSCTILDATDINNIQPMTIDDLWDDGTYKVSGYNKSAVSNGYRFIVVYEKSVSYDIGVLTGKTDNSVTIYNAGAMDTVTLTLDTSDSGAANPTAAAQSAMEKDADKRVVRYLHDGEKIYSIESLEAYETYTGDYTNGKIDSFEVKEEYLNYINSSGAVSLIKARALNNGVSYTVSLFGKGSQSLELISGGNVKELPAYNLGVLKKVYDMSNGDCVAEVITERGDVKTYTVSSANAESYKAYIKGETALDWNEQVIKYTATNDIITIDAVLEAENTEKEANYTASNHSIGDVKLGSDTVIINIDAESENYLLTEEDFADDAWCTVYGYDSLSDGTAGIVLAELREAYSIGVLQSVDGNDVTIYLSGNDNENTFTIDTEKLNDGEQSSLKAKLGGFMSSSAENRVIRFLHSGASLLDAEALKPTATYTGEYEDGKIGTYATKKSYINFCSDKGKLSYENTKRIVSNKELKVNTYSKGAGSFELVSGAEDSVITTPNGSRLELDDEYGWITNMYTKNNGEFVAQIMTADGVKEYSLADSVDYWGPNALVGDEAGKDGQMWTKNALEAELKNLINNNNFPAMWTHTGEKINNGYVWYVNNDDGTTTYYRAPNKDTRESTPGIIMTSTRPQDWVKSDRTIRLVKLRVNENNKITKLYCTVFAGNFTQNAEYYKYGSAWLATDGGNITDPYLTQSDIDALKNSDKKPLIYDPASKSGTVVVGGLLGGYKVTDDCMEFDVPSYPFAYNNAASYKVSSVNADEYNVSQNGVADDFYFADYDGVVPSVVVRFTENTDTIVSPFELDSAKNYRMFTVKNIEYALDDDDNIIYRINARFNDGDWHITTSKYSALGDLWAYADKKYTGDVIWSADSSEPLTRYLTEGDTIISDGNSIMRVLNVGELYEILSEGETMTKYLWASDIRNAYWLNPITDFGSTDGKWWVNTGGHMFSLDASEKMNMVEINLTKGSANALINYSMTDVTQLKPYSPDASEYDYALVRMLGGTLREVVIYRIITDGTGANPQPEITEGKRLGSDEQYGWIVDMSQADGAGEKSLKVMTKDGVKEYELADNVDYWGPNALVGDEAGKDGQMWTRNALEAELAELMDNNGFPATWSQTGQKITNGYVWYDPEGNYYRAPNASVRSSVDGIQSTNVRPQDWVKSDRTIRLVKLRVNENNKITKLYCTVFAGNFTQNAEYYKYGSAWLANDDGNITDPYLTQSDIDALKNSEKKPLIYNPQSKAGATFAGGLLGGYYLTDECVEFDVPNDSTRYEDEEAYAVRNTDSAEYNVKENGVSDDFYFGDYNGIVPGVLVRFTEAADAVVDCKIDTAANVPLMVVDKVEKVLQDGQTAYKVTGTTNGADVTFTTTQISALYDDILISNKSYSGILVWSQKDGGSDGNSAELSQYLHKGDVIVQSESRILKLVDVDDVYDDGELDAGLFTAGSDVRVKYFFGPVTDADIANVSWIEVASQHFALDTDYAMDVVEIDMSKEKQSAITVGEDTAYISDIYVQGDDEYTTDYAYVRIAPKGALGEVVIFRIKK